MASSEKFRDDQPSLPSGLTRRQFLPLLGATALVSAAPGILHAAPGGVPEDHPAQCRDSFTSAPTRRPVFHPAVRIRALPSAFMCSS